MCGISGFIDFKSNPSVKVDLISKMLVSIQFRGPDNTGYWVDGDSGIVFGHNRLSILDLSQDGNQPMFSPSKRYCITYNGEIYNFNDLKRDVLLKDKNINFHGTSDTAILLAYIEVFGLEKALLNVKGMFAFALYDMKENYLFLARDRFGEKPLYFYNSDGAFIFSSDLQSLSAHPSFNNSINFTSVDLFSRLNYVPDNNSIFAGVTKVPPAHYIKLKINPMTKTYDFIGTMSYWSIQDEIANSLKNMVLDYNEAKVLTIESLKKSVSQQMISDVDIGCFLSGGIDSSLIASIMQDISDRPINTFTIGFENQEYNEAESAKLVSNHLGSNHTELYVSDQDALSVVPKISSIYSEPFADSSQIPTFLVSQLAATKVKVALSGDGGDEIFGGYNRYIFTQKILNFKRKFPSILTQLIVDLALKLPNKFFEYIYTYPDSRKVLKVLRSLKGSSNDVNFYYNLMSSFNTSESLMSSSQVLEFFNMHPSRLNSESSFTDFMMFFDTYNYLPDDILTKVDRASMFNSIETRAPFLDLDLFKLAWSFPHDFKIKNDTGKFILRDILKDFIPLSVVERKKQGFAIPIDDWLRGALKEWGNDLISSKGLFLKLGLNHKKILSIWEMHQSKSVNQGHALWAILILLNWADNQKLK